MNEKQELPVSLKVVTILFILGGISAAIEVIVSLMHSRININFGVLGIFIGIGLFALKPGWRACGLVFFWIGLIGIPIITALILMTSKPLDFNLFGQKIGEIPKVFGLIMAIGIFLLCLWQYRVLTRSDIRQLFGLDTPEICDQGRI